MAAFSSSVLMCLVTLSFYGIKVNCLQESYSLKIFEGGAVVDEKVEVDVANQTEVIRVPQHNDVDAMDLMNDFKVGLSIRRISSTRACYVSKIDPSLPSPAKMKIDMDTISSLSSPMELKTRINELRVVGFANRSSLPPSFLQFCGNFPIFNIEERPLDPRIQSVRRVSGQTRRKRAILPISRLFFPCPDTTMDALKRCFLNELTNGIMPTLTCDVTTASCFYVAECVAIGGAEANCQKIDHIRNIVGMCCRASC